MNRFHAALERSSIRHWIVILLAAFFGAYSCAPGEATQQNTWQMLLILSPPLSAATHPTPDPRVGLDAGLFDAEEAIWNLNKISTTPPPADFIGAFNSDLAFIDNYAIQGELQWIYGMGHFRSCCTRIGC